MFFLTEMLRSFGKLRAAQPARTCVVFVDKNQVMRTPSSNGKPITKSGRLWCSLVVKT
jgi:hypothetical protein